MRTLRHLAGIFLGAVGLVFFLGFLMAMFEPKEDLSWWKLLLFFIGLGCLPLLCAAVLLKRSILGVRQRCCPACASGERAAAGVLITRKSWWAYQFGGWLLASLWGASRERQVRCLKCDTLYFTETRGTRIAGILLWIVMLFFLICAVMDSLLPQ